MLLAALEAQYTENPRWTVQLHYDNLAAQAPFTEIGRSVTQADFPRIIEAIREQNREEFGPDADRPD